MTVLRRAVLALCLLVCAAPAPALAAPPVVDGIQGTNGAEVPALEWGACPASSPAEAEALRDYRCTVVEVPLSYRDPAGQSIELALGLLPAADQENKLGTLFWNPGGPGVPGRIPPAFSDELHERFDLVGFDPRGVGESTPLRCFGSNAEALELFAFDFPITLAQERRVVELSRRGTERCAENGGPILEHMATANVARDLDLLRQAVGDPGLTYLGSSYGTHVGEVYANLFPDQVRAAALDAVVDPLEWTTGREPGDEFVPVEFRAKAYLGTYDALQAFLRACAQDERCALREEGADAAALNEKFDRLMRRLRRRALELVDPTGEPFTVTYQAAVYAVVSALYSPANSPELAETLQGLWLATEQRRVLGAARRLRRDLPLERPARPLGRRQDPDEPYFGIEWLSAVQCTDSSNPSNPWEWARWARRADREAPHFGAAWMFLSLPCATWPASDPDRYTGPWDRQTANPVLLVGNAQGDPATPYEDAVSTQRELADARLLTLDSFGHTAFFQSACVVDAVERYLVDLELPAEGAVCQPDRGPFDPLPEAQARRQQQIEDALGPVFAR